MAEFVREQTGRADIGPETRLVEDIGADGDDMFDLMQRYSERFGVNLSGYRWYFHHGEEGCGSVGALFCDPPHAQVPRLPITVGMLHEFAQRKCWSIQYPEQHVPRKRLDLVINRCFLLLVLFCIGGVVWRYFAQ